MEPLTILEKAVDTRVFMYIFLVLVAKYYNVVSIPLSGSPTHPVLYGYRCDSCENGHLYINLWLKSELR